MSIVYAAKVDSLYTSGDYQGAQEASDKAKKYAIIGAVVGVVCVVLYVVCCALFGFAAASLD